jgi:hypothetical protein
MIQDSDKTLSYRRILGCKGTKKKSTDNREFTIDRGIYRYMRSRQRTLSFRSYNPESICKQENEAENEAMKVKRRPK